MFMLNLYKLKSRAENSDNFSLNNDYLSYQASGWDFFVGVKQDGGRFIAWA